MRRKIVCGYIIHLSCTSCCIAMRVEIAPQYNTTELIVDGAGVRCEIIFHCREATSPPLRSRMNERLRRESSLNLLCGRAYRMNFRAAKRVSTDRTRSFIRSAAETVAAAPPPSNVLRRHVRDGIDLRSLNTSYTVWRDQDPVDVRLKASSHIFGWSRMVTLLVCVYIYI